MSSRFLNIIRILLILAFLVAAAATPTLAEAKTKAKRPVKKMKISFDGNEGSSSNGELRPRASSRSYETRGETVRLRAQNIDDIWASNGGGTSTVSDVEDDASDIEKLQSIEKTYEPSRTRGETTALDHLAKSEMIPHMKPQSPAVKSPAKRYAKTEPKPKTVRLAKALPGKVKVVSSPKAVASGESAIVKVVPAPEPPQAPIAHAAPRPTPRPTPEPEIDFVDMTKEAKALRASHVPERRRVIPREAPARSYIASKTRLETTGEPSSFTFNAALENTVTMGRTYELQEAGGRNFAMKNELFVGATGESGWGAKLSASFNSTSNADTSKDVREFGDPSVIVSHPSLYKDRDLDVYGRFRYYAPVATSSRAASLHHFAYYLLADLTLPAQMSVSNALIPRYFSQAEYADSDAYFLLYDSTELTKQLSSSLAIGIGQQTQIEAHHVTAAGTSIEAYPFVNFTGISKVLIQAKAYLPLYVNNSVGGAPTAAGLSNLQAEFFAKVSF
jgi:hypothetical protein